MVDPAAVEAGANDSDRLPGGGERQRSSRNPREKPSAEQARLVKEALLRLQHLRSAAREAARQHLANMERDIVALADLMKNPRVGSRKGKPLKRATLEHMITVLDDLSVKPEKGRRKDLKKIERTLEDLREAAKASGE